MGARVASSTSRSAQVDLAPIGQASYAPGMVHPPVDPDSPSRVVAFRLPEALLRRIDAEAKRRGLDRSATVRALLAEGLDRSDRRKS